MNISMPRGDIRHIKFSITTVSGDNPPNFNEIYFTVKKGFNNADALFQKKLSNGGIIKGDDGCYHFTIVPEDTNDLKYGDYVFDIELCYQDQIKQTTVGTLRITNEVTFAGNEGD